MTNRKVGNIGQIAFGAVALASYLTLSTASAHAAAIGNPNSGNGWSTTSVVSVTASSELEAARNVGNLIDGSGMNATGDLHDTTHSNMWLSQNAQPTYWVKFDLGSVYSLDEMHVWNYNEANWPLVGMKDVVIEYSLDDALWITLASLEFQLPPGSGEGPIGVAEIVPFSGASARYVMISYDTTGTDNHSPIHRYVGLSEVRFHEVPEPASLMLVGAGLALAACRRRRV